MAFSDSVKKYANLWYLWRKLKEWFGKREYKYTIEEALINGATDGGLNTPSLTGELSNYMREVVSAAEILITKRVQRWHKADEKLLPDVLKWKRQRVLLRKERQELDGQREIIKRDMTKVRDAINKAENDCKTSSHSHHSKFLFVFTIILVFGLDVALVSKAAEQFVRTDLQAVLFGGVLGGIFGAAAHIVGWLTANAWFPSVGAKTDISPPPPLLDRVSAFITLERVFWFFSWVASLILSVLGLYAISCVRVVSLSANGITLWPSSVGILFFLLQLMFFGVAVYASLRDQIPEVVKCKENKESKNKPATEIAALDKQIALIDKRLPFLDNKYDESRGRRDKFHAILCEEVNEIAETATQHLAAYQRANNMNRSDGQMLEFVPTALPFNSRCPLTEPSDEDLLQGLVSTLPPPTSPAHSWPFSAKGSEVM